MVVNSDFTNNILAMYGNLGKKWLQELPEIIKKYEKDWNITVLPPFTLSYNYVAPIKLSDNSTAVIKIGFPTDKKFRREIEALKIFNGEGTAKILKEDLENSIVILESIMPGDTLRSVSEDSDATLVATKLIKKLHKTIDRTSIFPTISDWGKGFKRHREKHNNTSGPIPEKLFDKAERIFDAYCKGMKKRVLLHGDLHHDNILASHRDDWLSIDPKGVIGEPEYEVGAFLRNPYPDLLNNNPRQLLRNRIDQFSYELQFDREKMKNWAVAQAVLASVWALEDLHYYIDYGVRVAEVLDELTLS